MDLYIVLLLGLLVLLSPLSEWVINSVSDVVSYIVSNIVSYVVIYVVSYVVRRF